jgi:signal transduction histidine kinase
VVNGLVRGHDLVHDELRHLARQVRRDGVIREVELDLPRGPLGRGRIMVRARVAPLGSDHVLLLVDDRTEARRVEDVRRDFVVNVSHELKTPVGGLALLAEAVLEANDDPEAVARFAHRMQVESTRLTRLVQEIVDLSRLEFAGTLHDPELVDVGAAAAEAIEQSRLVAGSRGAEIVSSLARGAQVFGDADLLTTAVRNLVGNAINYSAPGARVAVSVRSSDQLSRLRSQTRVRVSPRVSRRGSSSGSTASTPPAPELLVAPVWDWPSSSTSVPTMEEMSQSGASRATARPSPSAFRRRPRVARVPTGRAAYLHLLVPRST